jgi:hypothetical protein
MRSPAFRKMPWKMEVITLLRLAFSTAGLRCVVPSYSTTNSHPRILMDLSALFAKLRTA